MNPDSALAAEFDRNRPRLHAIAHRLLGSGHDADDAVQEAWLRLQDGDPDSISNLAGWLTTVVSRLAIDRLRSRTRRAETAIEDAEVNLSGRDDPEADAMLADSVSAALMVVLETLRPAERLAFVLHDSFSVSFEDIGQILGRSPNATKQLASRARNKVRGVEPSSDHDPARQRLVMEAFLSASRSGDFDALVALLDPDATLQADAAAVGMGSPADLTGAAAVAGMFSGRALGAQPALIDGTIGIAWIVADHAKVVWDVVYSGGAITHINMIADPGTISELDLDAVQRP